MALQLNLAPNGYYAPPIAYPLRLWVGEETSVVGVLPKTATTVTATVYAQYQANVHLAIFSIPTGILNPGNATNLSPDGPVVTTTDSNGNVTTYQPDIVGLTNQPQTISVSVPTLKQHQQPTTFVVRLWVDHVVGGSIDNTDRKAGGSYTVSTNPNIPNAVFVKSVQVS